MKANYLGHSPFNTLSIPNFFDHVVLEKIEVKIRYLRILDTWRIVICTLFRNNSGSPRDRTQFACSYRNLRNILTRNYYSR